MARTPRPDLRGLPAWHWSNEMFLWHGLTLLLAAGAVHGDSGWLGFADTRLILAAAVATLAVLAASAWRSRSSSGTSTASLSTKVVCTASPTPGGAAGAGASAGAGTAGAGSAVFLRRKRLNMKRAGSGVAPF